MSHHLRSCLECARHIRIAEAACPFCGATVPIERMSPPPRGTPAARLSRAVALSTIAAGSLGILGAAEACGSSPNPNEVITAQDAYGTVPPFDTGLQPEDAARDATPDVVITAADAYGTVPPFDTGVAPEDAGRDAHEGDADGAVEPQDAGPDEDGG